MYSMQADILLLSGMHDLSKCGSCISKNPTTKIFTVLSISKMKLKKKTTRMFEKIEL